MMKRRHIRGASALMAVMLLGALAAGALLFWHEDDVEDRRRAAARDDGRLLAIWLKAAHDATMISDYRTALAADPNGFDLVPGTLPGAPPGLPVPGGLTLGVMDDGGGVPMAWAVLVVERFSRGPARIGALDGGMAVVGIGGEAGAPMSDREAGVAAARGSALPAGSLFATADRGLPYQEEAVYRRQQPGRPWASRMDVNLEFNGNDMSRGGAFEGREAVTTGDVESRCVPQAGPPPCVCPPSVPTPPAVMCVVADVAGHADVQSSMNAGGLDTEALEAGCTPQPGVCACVLPSSLPLCTVLRVDGGMFGGRLELSGVNGLRVQGGSPASVTASGRVEAGSLRTIGRVDAGLLVIGGALDGVTDVTIRTGGMDARELVVENGFVSTGAGTVRAVGAGSLTAGGLNGIGVAVAGDAFGPSATISGTLTVGSCDGC